MYKLKSKNYLVVSAVLVGVIALYGCGGLRFSNAAHPYQPPAPTLKSKKFALVLGGGGAKGMAHIGVLEALEEANLQPDLIVGCSAGAIVGALYAANPETAHLKQLVLSGRQSDVISMSISEWPYSIYDDRYLASYLQKHIKANNFAQLKIPLLVAATNLEFGNLTAFGTGDLIKPIIASAAVPGAFRPIDIHGQYFVDCAAVDPVPVQIAKDLGYETIVAVNIAEQLPDTPPNHALGVIKRSLEISYIAQCNRSMQMADVPISFEFKNIGMFSDAYNEYLYNEGKKAGQKAIPKIIAHLKKH